METIVLSDNNLQETAAKAAAVISRGGVVLYPTETLYGLGADALSDDAVKKLYTIKGRPEGKPIHALVRDEAMAARYGAVTPEARALIAADLGALSLIVPKKDGANTGILRGLDSFGFRIASHPFCAALVRVLDIPVTTTSANRAGTLPYRAVPQILEQLGGGAEGIDLVIDAGELPECEPSTIVDLSRGAPEILREGVVSASAVLSALGKAAL